jgi:hypothetical protein
MHGLEVLKRLRSRGSSMPVLILTAADGVEERVKGLDYGADDYMAKPFSLQELEARVRALTRRGMGGTSSSIKHGPLVYDQTGRVASIDGKIRGFTGPMMLQVGPLNCGKNIILGLPIFVSVCGTQIGIQQFKDGEWISVADGRNGTPIGPSTDSVSPTLRAASSAVPRPCALNRMSSVPLVASARMIDIGRRIASEGAQRKCTKLPGRARRAISGARILSTC